MEAPPAIPESIRALVQSFEFHQAAYKRGQFNETQLRREFIDPFFKALGWDIDNNQRYSELYKDVIHEDPIRIRGSTEFIDYSFRIGGTRKFLVEAKKPGVNLKDDAAPALQIRRYAWNARLPLSILTDFEEFAVYDCTKKPMPGDTAATARIAYFTFNDYPEKWGWIASIFAKDSILQGSFDHFARETKGKKGTATVDEAILADIEEWRDALAKNLALRNPALTVDGLNVAVQRTIDRVLFLRICEDRGIEEYGCLQKLLDGPDVYQRLLAMFRRADTRYNSGLFHFSPEAGRDEMPDSLTPDLKIDDAVLKKIIKRLYYPESPYEFSVISPVILGQVYEQFLGKVIRLTSGHQAKVEYKPEVKKAGGVYYTPQYIVDYIVKETVGELVKDKTPREVASLRVLDPACGSGSFLLGAYQFLLDWHLEYYIRNLVPILADKPTTAPDVQALLPEPRPKSGKKRSSGDGSLPIYKDTKKVASRTRSDWKLTTAERKRILLNNIHGVDIDTQAVEVTKLSLLLKVLEEENEENVSKQLKLFDERVLPSLHRNIKCGNSLIGTDIYDDIPFDNPAQAKRINAFDWNLEFPGIIKSGGFDAVIGNPPYVRIHNLVEYYPQEVQFIQNKYHSAKFGKIDLYVPFVEKGHSLLNKSGLLGYICPNKFMQADYGIGLRKLISSNKVLNHLIDFSYSQVFPKATIYTCLLILSGSPQPSFEANFNNKNLDPEKFLISAIAEEHNLSELDENPWTLTNNEETSVLRKIERIDTRLTDFFDLLITGVKTGVNDIFVFENFNEEDNCFLVQPSGNNERVSLEKEIVYPYWKADSLKRYLQYNGHRVLLYPYEIINGKTTLIPESIMITKFPNAWRYLNSHKKALESRQKGKLKGKLWYGLSFSSDFKMFHSEKIVTPTLAPKNSFSIDYQKHFFPQGAGGGCGLVVKESVNKNYLLGVLNSNLLTFYFQRISSPFQSGWFAYEPRYLKRIPIRTIDFSDPVENARHDRMVALVERMLALHKQRADVTTDHEKNLIERQIEATDRQIDTQVYDLYGLTDDEIRIVEASVHKPENVG